MARACSRVEEERFVIFVLNLITVASTSVADLLAGAKEGRGKIPDYS